MSDMKPRLFIGVFPTGFSYADTWREEKGDYKRLGFLSFDLETETIADDCPLHLRVQIKADMDRIKALRGQEYQTDAVGHTVIIGRK